MIKKKICILYDFDSKSHKKQIKFSPEIWEKFVKNYDLLELNCLHDRVVMRNGPCDVNDAEYERD